jgi:hypothetical protein
MFLKQLSSILSHKEILSIFKNLYIEKTSGIFEGTEKSSSPNKMRFYLFESE